MANSKTIKYTFVLKTRSFFIFLFSFLKEKRTKAGNRVLCFSTCFTHLCYHISTWGICGGTEKHEGEGKYANKFSFFLNFDYSMSNNSKNFLLLKVIIWHEVTKYCLQYWFADCQAIKWLPNTRRATETYRWGGTCHPQLKALKILMLMLTLVRGSNSFKPFF